MPTNGTQNGHGQTGTEKVKRGLAQMLKGGVIMDVVTPEQAKIAEDAGASAVMALERIPADIRAHGGVSRMSDPDMVEGIMKAVTIPVMAKCRIGHFVEAQILESIGIDYIDQKHWMRHFMPDTWTTLHESVHRHDNAEMDVRSADGSAG